jgi:putative oxidoreductase
MDLALGLLLVRLIGFGLAAHGAQKVFGWFGGYGLAGTGGFMESLGFKPGPLFAAAAGTSEFAGGLLIALGLGGPIGPMLIIATMIVAIIAVHLPKGFFAQDGGYELPLIYAVLAVALALIGNGSYSLDAAFGLSALYTPAANWIAIALGVVGGFGNLALRRAPDAKTA